MNKIELFLQFEGNKAIELIKIDANAKVADIVTEAIRVGLSDGCAKHALVFVADSDEPLDADTVLSHAKVCDKHRVHIHRCRKIDVTVNFNELSESMNFPPSATVERVKKRSVRKFDISPVDATEHVLQLCCSTERPEPDTQIGALVSGCCSLCFDLVPIKRIEG